MRGEGLEKGRWDEIDEKDGGVNVCEGKVEMGGGEKEFRVRNVGYYKWEEEGGEKGLDGERKMVGEGVGEKKSEGVVVDMRGE